MTVTWRIESLVQLWLTLVEGFFINNHYENQKYETIAHQTHTHIHNYLNVETCHDLLYLQRDVIRSRYNILNI